MFTHQISLIIMNPKITTGIRILLGVMLVVFGLNKFLGFMPMPEMSEDANALMAIYGKSGFMSLIAVLEIIFGIALLAGKYVPLALTIITAIMFNAAVFHALHDMGGIGGAAVGLILSLVLVYANRDRFDSLLSA